MYRQHWYVLVLYKLYYDLYDVHTLINYNYTHDRIHDDNPNDSSFTSSWWSHNNHEIFFTNTTAWYVCNTPLNGMYICTYICSSQSKDTAIKLTAHLKLHCINSLKIINANACVSIMMTSVYTSVYIYYTWKCANQEQHVYS